MEKFSYCNIHVRTYHPNSGAVAGGEAFSEGNRSIHVNNISCQGNESAWINCHYNIFGDATECGEFEDAYIACQGESAL